MTTVRVAHVVASVLLSGVAMVAAGAEFSVFAAGSLRAPLADLAQAYERDSGNKARLTFGASGLLRDRISGGERADVFASANMEHPQSLAKAGWTALVERFARNSMCLLTGARSHATTASALDAMIDPAVKLGTSTPKADPSGDYAWEVFHKAEALRPGAFATLTAKARQLTGGPQSPPPPATGSAYGAFIAAGDADMFLTYCTNAELARQENPQLRVVRLPADLVVAADYGIAARKDASAAATAFVDYLRGPAGRRVFAAYGFDPP